MIAKGTGKSESVVTASRRDLLAAGAWRATQADLRCTRVYEAGELAIDDVLDSGESVAEKHGGASGTRNLLVQFPRSRPVSSYLADLAS